MHVPGFLSVTLFFALYMFLLRVLMYELYIKFFTFITIYGDNGTRDSRDLEIGFNLTIVLRKNTLQKNQTNTDHLCFSSLPATWGPVETGEDNDDITSPMMIGTWGLRDERARMLFLCCCARNS